MASLHVTNAEIYSTLGAFLGLSRDPDDWSADTKGDVERIIRSGRRRFFSASNWHFLKQATDILTEAPQTTGTIAVTNGVVTLTGATWPEDDTTHYMLAPEDGGIYTISEYTDPTTIKLTDTSLDVTAGSSYTLYRAFYSLPENFGGFEGPITVDNRDGIRESRNFPEYMVRAFAGQQRVRSGRPELFTVVPRLSDEEAGVPEYELQLYPLPDKVYVLSTRYTVAPGDGLSLGDDVTITHPVFAEAMLAAILSAAEMLAFDAPGVHTQRYQELITEAKAIDGRMAGIRYVRPRDRRSRPDPLRTLIDADVIIDS